MKGSNATSAKAKPTVPHRAGRPSPSLPSPIVDGFALTGPSSSPNPAFHAFRQDLADTALAGRVIASHYAEPLARRIVSDTTLMTEPSESGETVAHLSKGDAFALLDTDRGWAWGYGGGQRRVGYVRAEAVAAP